MVIHIVIVGRETGHIWAGLKEIIPAEKLYLLHSPNTSRDKFADNAKKLKKEYPVKKVFGLSLVGSYKGFDVISEI